LINGCPNIRWIDVPRVGSGEERVAQFFSKVIKALTDPLTNKELETGLYTPPPLARVAFEGSLLDAQTFYQKTTPISACRNCPIANWTDGLPVVIPSEEAVKEMLTGTSHKPDEYIICDERQSVRGGVREKGQNMGFMPNMWDATVEKVAINAVMAGCKPEYLPVVLAMAQSGLYFQATNTGWGYWQIVSGPIAKEIGMNAGQGALGGSGNPANSTIGRAFQLMLINLGGAQYGVTRTETSGSPFNQGGTCFAEDSEALPPGWLGLNEESTIMLAGGQTKPATKADSVVMMGGGHSQIHGTQYAPSSFRSLNEGKGGLARRLGVEGKPGKYNFLEYIVAELVQASEMGRASHTFIMHPNMAMSLYEYGFKAKQDVYNWIEKAGVMPLSFFRAVGWYDYSTNAGANIESVTGKAYKDLPDDYPVAMLGSASGQCLIVSIHPGDEQCLTFTSGRGRVQYIERWK
jgi:hypothetical protein